MSVETIVRELLGVLLQLLELFVGFMIQALSLILNFARAIFGSF